MLLQTHYLQPQLNVYLVKNQTKITVIKRHEKNRLTQQTTKGFVEYDYEPRLNLPIKHWFVTTILAAINYASRTIEYTSIIAKNWLQPKFKIINLPIYKHEEITVPSEIKVPSYLRNMVMSRFYHVKDGALVAKKLTVNVDLLQRIMTTKAINYHQPIEQQMKTITALINNQSDINYSDLEFERSTVSDTLSFSKFQLLNQTSDVAEMGFQQASIKLQQSMVIDTTMLTPDGGHHYQRNRKRVLEYEPPNLLICGLIGFGLFSVILVSQMFFSVYLTRTFQTLSVQFLGRSKDLGSTFLSWLTEQNQSEGGYFME